MKRKHHVVDGMEFYTIKPSFSAFDTEGVIGLALFIFLALFAVYITVHPFTYANIA